MSTSNKLYPALMLCAAALLCACSAKNDGREFLGKWEPAGTSGNGFRFEITKSGDQYLLTDETNAKFPAVYDPQKHVLDVTMPLVGQVPFSYDGSTHKVLALGDEFQAASGIAASDAAQSASPVSKLDKDALAFGKGLMTPNLTVCNGRTFAMLSEGDRAAAPWLAEIKDPTFATDSDAVSQADGLNGLDYHGTVDLRWSAYRVLQHGQWTQWIDANDALSTISVAGTEEVYILHKKGQWVHDDSYAGKTDFAGLRRKPISCETLPK